MFLRLSLQGPPRLVRSASPFGYDLPRYLPVACGVYIFYKVSFEKHPYVQLYMQWITFPQKAQYSHLISINLRKGKVEGRAFRRLTLAGGSAVKFGRLLGFSQFILEAK